MENNLKELMDEYLETLENEIIILSDEEDENADNTITISLLVEGYKAFLKEFHSYKKEIPEFSDLLENYLKDCKECLLRFFTATNETFTKEKCDFVLSYSPLYKSFKTYISGLQIFEVDYQFGKTKAKELANILNFEMWW